ncbi:unnamed protein product [Amoebophrya sp. A25]|nr:unnamed protein product [Amoebophrya sp. A25]|eukprot:GSA25T00020417001.1
MTLGAISDGYASSSSCVKKCVEAKRNAKNKATQMITGIHNERTRIIRQRTA